jgi:hypothetical protein
MLIDTTAKIILKSSCSICPELIMNEAGCLYYRANEHVREVAYNHGEVCGNRDDNS